MLGAWTNHAPFLSSYISKKIFYAFLVDYPNFDKLINNLLKTFAKEKEIPYQVESFIGRTCTDGDTIHLAGTGTTTALVSLPLRYMHNPNEMCSLQDVENAIELIAEFLCRVDENTDFDPFH